MENTYANSVLQSDLQAHSVGSDYDPSYVDTFASPSQFSALGNVQVFGDMARVN